MKKLLVGLILALGVGAVYAENISLACQGSVKSDSEYYNSKKENRTSKDFVYINLYIDTTANTIKNSPTDWVVAHIYPISRIDESSYYVSGRFKNGDYSTDSVILSINRITGKFSYHNWMVINKDIPYAPNTITVDITGTCEPGKVWKQKF